MRNTTYRQYRAWQRWLDQEWEEPNLICHYLMQLTAKVHNLFAKNPVTAEKFRLKFVRGGETPVAEDRELTQAEKDHITMAAKSRWGAISGLFSWNKRQNKEEIRIPK